MVYSAFGLWILNNVSLKMVLDASKKEIYDENKEKYTKYFKTVGNSKFLLWFLSDCLSPFVRKWLSLRGNWRGLPELKKKPITSSFKFVRWYPLSIYTVYTYMANNNREIPQRIFIFLLPCEIILEKFFVFLLLEQKLT